MKRFMLLIAALGALTVALTSANARTDQARSICHRTGSATKPYVKLRVTAASAPGPYEPSGGHHPGAGRRVSEDAPRRQRRDRLQHHDDRQRGEPRGRSGRNGDGDCSAARRAGPGLLPRLCRQPRRRGRGDAHPQGCGGRRRAGGDPARDSERGRQGRRVRRCLPGARRADPRLAGGVLPERPHRGVPGRRGPRPADRHVRGGCRHDHLARPEGHERAERERLGSPALPQRAGLLPPRRDGT